MKKRIFTLFALAMLIGGVSSTLKAQTSITKVVIGYTSFGTEAVYEVKADASKEKLATSRTQIAITVQNVSGIAGEDTIIKLSTTDAATYLGLPNSVTIKKDTVIGDSTYIFTYDHNWNMPNEVNGSKGIVYAYFGNTNTNGASDTAKYYNYPEFTVNYVARTTQYIGLLEIASITGSNPEYEEYMTRKLNKDDVFAASASVFTPFSDADIARVTYGDKIRVIAPWDEYILDIPGVDDEITPGTLLRPVTIPVVFDAALSREPGIHQTPSAEDFTFTIKPTGSNVGKVPTVSTGRTDLPDSEGVTYAKLSDGSYLVTIVRVQSPINLTIDFATGNAAVENNSVWSNGNLLYMSTATNGVANIYSITGALVNTVALTAGETANVSLPTGFYVVTVNGKAYKVTVK